MIVENIRRLCNSKGVTIKDLETSIGLGKNTVYKWAESSPSVANLKKVADFFGCTVDELLNESEVAAGAAEN